jgi:hypothetical protein
MRKVIIESPFMADTPEGLDRNLRYLRACQRDCLKRGEAPFASHGLYVPEKVIDDGDPVERDHGIKAGFAWREMADATVVYTDLGISSGMLWGVKAATVLRDSHGYQHEIEYRTLGGEWAA